ncbi:MAG: hypothetical protein JOY73_01650 [Actinobacteria bacterium]|nr:hypothetical protein [Actinomycetota bacterium]
MKKLLIPLVAGAALALPTSALAWGGHHGHHGDGRDDGVLASLSLSVRHGDNDNDQGNQGDHHSRGFGGSAMQLSGTGTSFGATSASITGTGLTGTLSTTWTSATTKTFGTASISCAPATASLTIGTAAADTFTGKTCSWTKNGTTLYGFFGSDTNGAHAFLKEDGTTVTGAVVMGRGPGMHLGVLAGSGMMNGNCDH